MTWLAENAGTIVAALLVCAVVAAILVRRFKQKKKGCSSCSGGCANCPLDGKCH